MDRCNVDYENPLKYLEHGSQTQLSDESRDYIIGNIGIVDGIIGMKNLLDWVHKEFCNVSGKGQLIGKNTVENILEKKELSGCHDYGLLVATILRTYSVPATIVETAAIDWAKNYKDGEKSGFEGHVFVEVYDDIQKKWMLIDPVKQLVVLDYDSSNPIIPIEYNGLESGFYTIEKGLDTKECGINGVMDLTKKMIEKVDEIKKVEMIDYPEYETFDFKTMRKLEKAEPEI